MKLIETLDQKLNSAIGFIDTVDVEKQNVNNDLAIIYNNLSKLSGGWFVLHPEFLSFEKINVSSLDISPTDKFTLPFDEAIRIYNSSEITANTYANILVYIKYRPRVAMGYWMKIPDISTTIGFQVRYCGGENDNTNIARYDCTIATSLIPTIKASIDNGTEYEDVRTGFNVFVDDYIDYDGETYIHIGMECTTDVANSDAILVSIGGKWGHYTAGQTVNDIIFGLQLQDNKNLLSKSIDVESKSIVSKANFVSKASNYEGTYSLDNKFINFVYGGNVLKYPDGTLYATKGDGILRFLDKGTYQNIQDTLTIDDTYHEKFIIKRSDDGVLDKFVDVGTPNYLFTFLLNQNDSLELQNKSTLSFWVNRDDLNDNGLIINGVELTQANMLCEGFRESTTLGNTLLSVNEVNDTHSHISIYFEYYIKTSPLGVGLLDTGSDLNSITLYNTTIIQSQTINPLHRYPSRAEKNGSKWIGKNIALIGDSQYNDTLAATYLISQLGCNVIDAHRGGRSMQFKSGNIIYDDYYSFYNENNRDELLAVEGIDLYLMTCSTNDISSNDIGSLSESAVNYVLDNYPLYQDDSATKIAKQALFDALTDQEIDDNFTYLANYSAYIKQIYDENPTAKIMLCSVPISVGGQLTGNEVDGHGEWDAGKNADTARLSGELTYNELRTAVIDVKSKHNCYFADVMNEVGMTYENAYYYIIDGTHWLSPIKYRIALSWIAEINKIFI